MDAATLRQINREVAAKFLPELPVIFDQLVSEGFKPKLISLTLGTGAQQYFDQLVKQHEESSSQGPAS